MPRQISDNGQKFTAAWETFRSAPYHATDDERKRGIFTWGYGHTGNKPPVVTFRFRKGLTCWRRIWQLPLKRWTQWLQLS